jgi:SAM-dependent methyltransferase
MIERARTRYPGILFELEDAEALTRASDSFDAVTMNFGILHLANPERAVAEAARVLRKGGRFGFTVWAPPSDALGFSVVLEAIERHGDAKVVLPAGPPFFKYSAPEASRVLLEGAGLSEFAFDKIDLLWQLSSAEDFFTAFYEGTARTGGLLRAQPKECLERIREAVIGAVRDRFGSAEGNRVEIPMPATMYSARR